MIQYPSGICSRIRKIRPEQAWLAAILLIAAGLRLYHYNSFSYSNDELSAINRLQFKTFHELVKGGFYVDGHPGGIQVFLWYWSGWFGNSETSLRLPFVAFGILAVGFAYLVARRMFGKVAALFTSASLAFLQFPLMYSQIARPYVSGLFFCLLMVYFWLRVLFDPAGSRGKPRFTDLAGYSIATALCMYNHYFSFFFAVMVGISGLIFLQRKRALPYLLSGTIACLLFVPHIPVTLNHLTYKGVGLWLGKPGPEWPFRHIYFIFNESRLLILLLVVTSVLLSLKGRQQYIRKAFPLLALTWFALPMAAGYIYSIRINPILQHSVLIFSFPFLLMIPFMAAGNEFGRLRQLLLGIYLAGGLASTLAINKYYQTQHFGEFKGVAEYTAKWDREFGADSISRVVVANSPFYVNYYLDRLGHPARFDLYDIRTPADMDSLGKLVQNCSKPYFLYAWTKPPPEGVDDIIRSRFPFIKRCIHFGTLSTLTLYGKIPGSEFESGLELKTLAHQELGFEAGSNSPDPDFQLTERKDQPGNFCLVMDINKEYSPALEISLDSCSTRESIIILAKVEILTKKLPSGAMLVTAVENAEGKSIVWEASLADYTAVQDKWCPLCHVLKINGINCKAAKLKIYIWNRTKQLLQLDNLQYTIYQVGKHSPFSQEQFIWGDL